MEINGVLIGLLALAVAGLAAALAVALRRASSPPPATSDVALQEAVRSQALRLERVAATVEQGALGQEALRRGMDDTRALLADLSARDEERRRRDDEAARAWSRLESVLLGGSSRGRMGENVVAEALSQLSPDVLERDVALNGKTVEFALRLPDGRRLPVDSKWTAMAEAQQLEEADGDERVRLSQVVEKEAALRAREVAKYLGPASAPFAVAAVPDPVYA
ncbi:MAG TPA: DNA recombination protein RmuC, partial [Actinomycetota bacterium]|nr:DNA recombination protein RmuC [Actinomycetota bacterium]